LRDRVVDKSIVKATNDENYNSRRSVYKPEVVVFGYTSGYIAEPCD